MGHQSNDAGKALRAYARDLQSSATRASFAPSVGTSKQDDAPNQLLGSGAPHQLAIAAAVVCVVLLGGIGLAAATNPNDSSKTGLTNPATAQADASSAVLLVTSDMSTPNAIRAFNDLGLSRAANALDAAAGAGIDSSPAVQQAVERIFDIIDARLDSAESVGQSEVTIALAIADLESAVQPPGLDIALVRSGHENLPPGLDDVWLEQVKRRGIPDPADEAILVPPGHTKADPQGNGRDSAPGQTKDKPEKGGDKP
jgi:hypothetical protein